MTTRRRNMRLVQLDDGSNFLGAENILKKTFLEVNNKKID